MLIIDELRKFLLENKLIKASDEITDSDSLLEHGIIDSVGIQGLVQFLEEKYNIAIDDDDLMPDNFDSLEAIDAFVSGKRS